MHIVNKLLSKINLAIVYRSRIDLLEQQAKKTKKYNKNCALCKMPFSFMEIHKDGRVFPCCPLFIKSYSYGNIFEQDFDEIWNSVKAQSFRQNILDNNYSACNLNLCAKEKTIAAKELENNLPESFHCKPIMSKPRLIKFCHDDECNLKCTICRDSIKTNTKEHVNNLNSYIDKLFIPMLKGVPGVCFSGNGDPFASRHYRTLMHEIVKEYPYMRFDLHTNGLLCNEKNCDSIGITNNLSVVQVTVNATTPQTYNKIMRGSSFNKVLSNIEWLATLKRQGKLDDIFLIFVVMDNNFREMPSFADMAYKYNAKAFFWDVRPQRVRTELFSKPHKMEVFLKNNPHRHEYEKIIASKELNQEHCFFNNILT